MSNFIEMLKTLDPVGMTIVCLIIATLITAFIINIILIIRYRALENDILSEAKREKRLFDNIVLNKIVEDYTLASSKHFGEINTQAIIEKHFAILMKMETLGERFVKTSISLMIILGLIGTFFGLTISISKLVGLLAGDLNAVLSATDSITDSLINALSGMSIAFVTSLFGISSSIIMTILTLFFNAPDKRIGVMSQIEEYLDNRLFKEVREDYFKYHIEKPENNTKVEQAMLYPDISMQRLHNVAKELSTAANAMTKSTEKFEQSLATFGESARDFKEFNYHLKDNIARMSVAFADLSEVIKEQNKTDKAN